MESRKQSASEPLSIMKALSWAREVLSLENGVVPPGQPVAMHQHMLDAEVILAHVLKKDRTFLFAHPEEIIAASLWEQYQDMVGKRIRGMPVAYLTGEKEFMSLTFSVNPDVLIPRPETEILVETALSFLKPLPAPLVAETCTGSGIIAVSLAKYLPDCRIRAVDISREALRLARANAHRHGVAAQVEFFEGDLFGPLMMGGNDGELDAVPGLPAGYDLVAANPPYISKDEFHRLSKDVLFEPSLALKGGDDGLHYYPELINQAFLLLKPGGLLLIEIGASQGQAVTEKALAHGGYRQVSVIPDYACRDRVLYARKRSE